MTQTHDTTPQTPATRLLCHAPQAAFVLPYIARRLPEVEIVTDPDDSFDLAVMLSTVDVYNVSQGSGLDESTAVLSGHPMTKAEDEFRALCASRGVAPTVLRCANTVGTGMNGWPMDVARRIDKGTYLHIKGVDERISTVHATDVAKAVALTLGSGRTYNVTDGADPTHRELAEALAWRLNQKRIMTIGERWARWRYSGPWYYALTTTRTFSCEALRRDFAYEPVPVCEYLRTHVYDHDSL